MWRAKKNPLQNDRGATRGLNFSSEVGMAKDKVGHEGMFDLLNEEVDLGPGLGPNLIDNTVDPLLLCEVNYLVGQEYSQKMVIAGQIGGPFGG